MIKRFLILIGMINYSCADKFHDVTIEGFSTNKDNFTEMKQLGLILDGDFDSDFRTKFLQDIKTCKNFKAINSLKSNISLKSVEPEALKKEFEKTIAEDSKARSQNGILTVDLTFKKINSSMEKSTAFKFSDKKNYRWYTNYGIPLKDQYGFSSKHELAPERKVTRKPIYIRYANYIYKIRYVLFNRVTDKVVLNSQEETISTFSNYSRKPSLKKSEIQKVIFASLRQRIVRQVCAEQPIMEQIYNAPGNSPSSQAVNQGVEFAKQGRWKLAADKWENALLKDKKSAIAHHNLGIYYEYMGQLQEALPHYEKERYGSQAKLILKPRAANFLKSYQLPDLSKPVLPQISFISAGNWVYILSNGENLKLRNKYSIYRIELNRKEDDQSVTGTHIREVGVVKLVRKEGNYYQGRITQSIIDYPILPGDFLVK